MDASASNTIDTCVIPSQTHFCDEDGYDVVPIRVINLVLPRKVNKPTSKVLTPKKQKTTPSLNVNKRWVPKTILRAQGYYQGTKLIWIPKAKKPTSSTKPTQTKTNKDTIPRVTIDKPTKYWCPEKPNKTNVTSEPNETSKPKGTRQVWIPKQKQLLISSNEVISIEVA